MNTRRSEEPGCKRNEYLQLLMRVSNEDWNKNGLSLSFLFFFPLTLSFHFSLLFSCSNLSLFNSFLFPFFVPKTELNPKPRTLHPISDGRNQSFGHPCPTDFGQTDFGQTDFGQTGHTTKTLTLCRNFLSFLLSWGSSRGVLKRGALVLCLSLRSREGQSREGGPGSGSGGTEHDQTKTL